MKTTTYYLPDGRSVEVNSDVAHGRSWVDYTLADGRIVTAVIAPRQCLRCLGTGFSGPYDPDAAGICADCAGTGLVD